MWALAVAAYTIGWTLAGGVGGYLLGRLTRDVARWNTLEETASGDEALPIESRRRVRLPSRLLLGLVIVVLGILTAVQGIITSNRVAALQQCQAHYSNGFADALEARTAASGHSQQALDDMVRAIRANLGRNDPKAAAALSGAIDRYLQQRDSAVAGRKAHPYPAPPRESCQ